MKIDYCHHYRKFHPDTAVHRAAMTAYYRRILAPYLPADKSLPVLDVGCGMGFALLALKEDGFTSVEGVDCDDGQVAAAQKLGLEVSLSSDTVRHLKSRENTYQLILALDVIEHIPRSDQLEFVQALATALVPGGRLICTVPNANSALASRWRYIDWTHHTSFSEHSLDFLLFNGGLKEIQIRPVEFNERPTHWWLPFLSGARHWWAFRFFRLWRRLEMMAELGPEQGRSVPLSLNLLGIAKK